MAAKNPFSELWALGYQRLIPIIPPGSPISENSSLFKRIGTPQDGRGKTPGVKGRDGNWYSFDWVPYETTEDDLGRWYAMEAGVGMMTGRIPGTPWTLVAVDADTLDAEHARIIKEAFERRFGRSPIRVGQYPKALYVLLVEGDYTYTRVEFGERDAKGRLKDRVEILSDGRQFVAHGSHPKTGKPYDWPRALVKLDELPYASPAELDDFMRELRDALPAASELVREGATTDVNQDALKGDLDAVRRAVEATPNTSEHFPTRESYRDFGYAIKGALQDHPDEALALFKDWCDRWADDVNDPDVVEADWRRMKGPYKVGASKLFETAERVSGGKFREVDIWFKDEHKEPSPFAEIELNAFKKEEERVSISATPYGFPDPARITPRQWIYGHHYIRKFVSATVAPSGVGKSSLEIVESLAMASGKPLLGVEPRGQFRVWLWNGEDPRDELDRRIAAAMMHYGLTAADIEDRLFVDSGRDMEIILATEGRDGAKIATPMVGAVMSAIKLNRLDVFQVDPFVSSHRVSENDNGAIDLVSKQWARIADECNCAVELVHHVRKLNGAEITVEDSRGATALVATSRSARAISRMTRGEAARLGLESVQRRLFRFGDGKNNLALPADERTDWFQLASVGLGNGRGDGLDAILTGDSVGVVSRFAVPAAAASVVTDEKTAALASVAAGEWRRDVRSGEAWVGNAIASAMRLDVSDDGDKARVKAIITEWLHDGTLREVVKQDAKRMQKTFIEVGETATSADILSQDVFG